MYTIDNTTLSHQGLDGGGLSEEEDGVSYFGSAGQDFLLKKKRARRSRLLYWIDLAFLLIFLGLAGLTPPSSGSGDEGGSGSVSWTWTWERIPWPLTVMAVLRILLMAFTARYSHGNYNATVIFACVLMTLILMFQINMIIQHRMALSTALVAQYAVSIIITQFHWISYSAHTPMSATLYAYDPLLHDSITFSRESRYLGGGGGNSNNGGIGINGAFPRPRPTTLRRGTSYGTMSNSPFDAVQELDEEQDEDNEDGDDDDDQDVFIKVNVDRRQTSRTTTTGHNSDDDDTSGAEGVEDEEEEQDMATLLAFQEQRRLKSYGVSATATTTTPTSPGVPAAPRTGRSPQMMLTDSGTPLKSPLSWAFRGMQHDGSATSSYNVRLAASGSPGAAAVAGAGAGAGAGTAGGLTVGYGTPRRRPFKSDRGPNGIGRRTWTGGHSIIYSGIFVDDDSDDEVDEGSGKVGDLAGAVDDGDGEGKDVDVIEKLEDGNFDGNEKEGEKGEGEGEVVVVAVDHTQEQLTFDDTIKVEIDSSAKVEAEPRLVVVAADDTVKTGVKAEVVTVTGDEVVKPGAEGDAIKVEVAPDTTVHVDIVIEQTTTTTKTHATTRETKTVHRHGLTVTGPGHSEDGLDLELVDADGQLVVGDVDVDVVLVGDTNSSGSPTEESVDGQPKPHLHPHFEIPSPPEDDAEKTTAIDRPSQESKSNGEPHGVQLPEGHHRGLSTLRFNISSHKDITAVICDDEDCDEHPYQEGPAAELEAATGYKGGHIVQLDIKESETTAQERTGDGINDFEDSSDSGTILGLPDHLHPHHHRDGNGLEILPAGTISVRREGGDGTRHDHGSTDILVGGGERTKKTMTALELENGGVAEVTDPAVLIVPGNGTIDPHPSRPGIAIGDTVGGEGEGVHRRIYTHERCERVTIEEGDRISTVGVHGVQGVHGVHGVHGVDIHGTVNIGSRDSSEDSRIGGVVIVDGDGSGTILVPPRYHHPLGVPGQWVDIDDQGPPTGVITWGVADDIPPYMQDGVIIESGVEPVVYIPPQRTVIVQPPPRPIAVAVPQEPVAVIQPATRPVVVSRPVLPPPMIAPPAPVPIIQIPPPQPQMLVRPQPQPVAYRLPPRAQVIQAPPAPVYQPIVQPPRVVVPPPPQLPPPQVLYQPQPRAVVPAMVASAPVVPVVAPTYGTFETIVPGVVGGVAGVGGVRGMGGIGAVPGGVAVGGGMGARPYSVASIYDDQSIVSIYEKENYSVASIYDDRSIASIDGVGHVPAGYAGGYAGGYVGVGHPYVAGGRALPGMAYGRHLVSAAHVPRDGGADAQQARHIEPSEYVDDDQGAEEYSRNRHDAGSLDLPRYRSAEDMDELVESLHGFRAPESEQDYRRRDYSDDRMEVDSEILVENCHTAFPSDSTNTEISASTTETSYHEIQLKEGPAPLQELAIETYYDTTKSQLKVRENQGRLLSEMAFQLKKRQQQEEEKEERQQEKSLPLPDSVVPRSSPSPVPGVSSLSPSFQNQNQNQHQQQPPTLNIPKPPTSPPPVRLLVNRGVPTPLLQAKGVAIPPRSPAHRYSPTPINRPSDKINNDAEKDDKDSEPILSTSSKSAENIMLLARNQKSDTATTAALLSQEAASKARSLISGSILHSSTGGSRAFERSELCMSQSMAMHPAKTKETPGSSSPATSTRKTRRKQSIPPMSRNHLHPFQLPEGIMACWNNEFGGALEIFKDYSTVYPRWSLAAAEVHIVRQLISGQLSEADSELTDALQLSEKVASRVLDKKTDFDTSFLGYQSICSADASLITVNDNTLRQNYKWDCEMAFYDTLLYRGILQLTSASDTKGTFSDIKGGLQLRRAWKGYMRIKQEMEIAKERWRKLTALSVTSTEQDAIVPTMGEDDSSSNATRSAHLSKTGRPTRLAPIPIAVVSNAPPPSSRRNPPLTSSQSSEGSRWSLFGRRGSWNQSAASLSSSPTDASEFLQDNERTRSRFMPSSPSAHKGLASALREQTKAVEDLKTAVKVLEDVEDYLLYGLGLFYFIVTVVPKSLLPALRTIGLQSNHELGIKNLEAVFARKNGRAPFAGLYLLINYLFLPRGMEDASISLGRAGEIVAECLKICPNGSSYLLMACHHARKTGNMIPAALNHITRGIQTCEAAVIPSINYRFELGLTFFIHQEFGKAADVFEILWRRFITTQPVKHPTDPSSRGKRRKGRSNSVSQHSRTRNDPSVGLSSSSPVGGDGGAMEEEEEEDDFELAPFCGLCLIASKVVLRLGQEGYFEYGRDGFGHHGNDGTTMSEGSSASRLLTSGSTTPINYPRTGPEFDLLMAAQEVLIMMAGPELAAKHTGAGSVFEHIKAGSSQSTWSARDVADGTGTIGSMATLNGHPLLTPTPPPQAGKCQKSLQKGRISPFLPLVILYLRRDLAYMKPALLRKYRTLLETIWKSVQHSADIDAQAIYLLLSAVVHRQLLPDDATFAYTALTDCLLLEATIESEMWVVPYCHYELGELLYRKLHLPQAALEQFQWIVKGPGKELRPTSVFYASAHNSNPRLSVYGGGYPSDTVTNLIESSTAARGGGHSKHPSTASTQRLSQMFPTGLGNSGVAGSPSSHAGFMAPPSPMAFYNSRYKKFEFSQSLRQRSAVCIEQVQKVLDSGASPSAATSRRTSMADQTHADVKDSNRDGVVPGSAYNSLKKTTKVELASLVAAQEQERTSTLKRSSLQSVDPADQLGNSSAVKTAKRSGKMSSGRDRALDSPSAHLTRSASESSAHVSMVKKVIDSRIHTLIKNGVQSKHRTFFVLVGDKGKDQVVNLHWLLSQAQVTARPSVLWCYKKELGFSSHRKKREAKIKRDVKRGVREINEEDPFELFISVTNIRYTYYKETQKILGNTYGMCVLQDFEALTPNLLARTIETVEGGGIIVLLLKSMSSLKQLYTMTMDVHSRYRTESHDDVVARFNERFILSLGSCPSCLVVDDELNVLPISLGKNVKPLPIKTGEDALTDEQRDLIKIKESVQDQQPMGALVGTARTKDQAIAVMKFIEAIAEKTLRSTVTLTASRGRGKSAALGIAMASAVAYGYSNIFVTSPSPENLKTLFEFVFKGFDALGYEEHMDYDIVQSTNPEFNNAIVRVNIFKRDHRQTIQYIQPQDAHTLGQAELVVIDEAAAIPLPLVKALLGPYLVFMASTINGYEGTGRSLSLKLIQQLREQSRGFVGKEANAAEVAKNKSTGVSTGARTLREIELKEPIRYAPEDPTEKWLNKLLCLDATVVQKNISGCPAKEECQLFYVNRDTLFSYHPVSETFLQRMMALYVASHYKNTPNDLQLLSDAPSHHLFVLLPPIKEGDRSLPDPLCVLQVCLEGEISKQTVLNSLSRGVRAAGDLIPWLISQQFQDDDFASLSGARVVRIATHPDYVKMGYGSRALELLSQFYEGQFSMLSEDDDEKPEYNMARVDDSELEGASLMTDDIKIRDPKKMPPLLLKLSEKKAEKLHWLGVSFGLTAPLHKFWSKSGYVPVYLRQTPNDLTGEHTCVMLRTLESSRGQTQCDPMWLSSFSKDFHHRFQSLLSFQFRTFPATLALSILESARSGKQIGDSSEEDTEMDGTTALVKKLREGHVSRELVDALFSAYDLKRLESYANQLLDYHVILDLLPLIASIWFDGKVDDAGFKLTSIQSALLLALGLQRKSIDDFEKEIGLSASQLLAFFIKMIRKFSDLFKEQKTRAYTQEIESNRAAISAKVTGRSSKEGANKMKRDVTKEEQWDPNMDNLDDELGKEGRERLRELQKASLGDVEKMYAISNESVDWAEAEAQIDKKGKSTVVSVKNPESTKKRNLVAGGTASEVMAKEAKEFVRGKASRREAKSAKRRKV
ncbi:hypothetical protein BGX33_008423 [Mortierella sp. NVP41]|nr:hypothetical protein BGX33_008423 [Mortierella sp. NVP41]